MDAHTYKIIELVGSSHDGLEPAIENAIGRASGTLKNLDWFEVREIRGNIDNGKVGFYQVKLGVGFQILEPEDAALEV